MRLAQKGLCEFAAFERAAKSSGVPVSAYIKACAMQAHEGRTEPPDIVLEELAELHRLVRTIANNVNQMARHSNRVREVLDEHEVFASIQSLQSAYEEAIRKTGMASAADEKGSGGPGR